MSLLPTVLLALPPTLVLFAALLCRLALRSDPKHPPQNARLTFRVATWVYGMVVTAMVLFGVFVYWALDSSRPQGARQTLAWVGIGGQVIGLVAIRYYSLSRVQLSETEVQLRSPGRLHRVRFADIKEVRLSNGMIVVDAGAPPRMVIPMIYQDTGALLISLQHRRPYPRLLP